jgi:2-polyprenyl-3-methyl-5-hydroxy-6-metoxy-1,4-benzoquinol methylase
MYPKDMTQSNSMYLQKSRDFYNHFFNTDSKLTYDNSERYAVVFGLIEQLNLPSDSVVLDVGSGSGRIAAFLQQHFENVTTLDITCTPLMQQFISSSDIDIKFGVAALPNLPLLTDQFDLVVFSEVLEHLPPTLQQNAIVELSRVIKFDGHLILSTPNPDSFFEIIRKPLSIITHKTPARRGQLLENFVKPAMLRQWLRNEFTIDLMQGSYYLFPPVAQIAERLPLLYNWSSIIHERGWLKSRGLYQYYMCSKNQFAPQFDLCK